MSQEPQHGGFDAYLGQQVVVDTRSTYIILGTLTAATPDCLTLENVDVHDTTDGSSTKDHYIMESHKLGIRTNRRAARVRIAEVISVSLLRDVEIY
jgi:hypothetical protein